MIELLAPAGNEECFFAAINNGADAVYLGLNSFSARKNAGNFTRDNIRFYVSYAHAVGVKVYVALNTLIKDSELEDFIAAAKTAYEAGADALIVQDVFSGKILKGVLPDCELHLSTQAGVNNLSGVKIAEEYGFSRVILARETEEREIKSIAENIDTEIFVHGALCSSFSGHCYMSSFIGGNSGNRGLCKQPCRKKYVIETKTGEGKYSFSLSDLNLAGRIGDIIKLGVKSVKIEGRMRTPEYVAAAVGVYRKAIDGLSFDLSEIKRTYNRGDYTEGYVFGFNGGILSDKIQNHCGEYFGLVKRVYGGKLIFDGIKPARCGDGFKILRNGFETGNAVCLRNGKELDCKGDVRVNDVVMITRDAALSEELLNAEPKRKAVSVVGYFSEGEKPYLEANGIKVVGETVLEKAKSSPLTNEEVCRNLLKTDKYPFAIIPSVTIIGEPFIVKSQLNKLRCELYEKIFSQDVKTVKNADYNYDFIEDYDLSYKGIVMSDGAAFVPDNHAFVLRPDSYDDVKSIAGILDKINADKFLFVPAFLSGSDEAAIKKILYMFDGIYADGLCGITLWRETGKKIIAGTGLNSFNSVDFSELSKLGVKDIIYSKELSLKEIGEIKSRGYVFSFGRIKLAEFLYCPFGKKCGQCKRGNAFSVTDETGHKFVLSRYKLGGRCRFELYNGDLIKSDKINYNFYNFTGFSERQTYDFFNGGNLEKEYSFTNGNLKRGVL